MIKRLLKKCLDELNVKIEHQAKLHKNQFMISKNSLKRLQKLSTQFFNSISKKEDFGISQQEIYIKFISDFGKITIFE